MQCRTPIREWRWYYFFFLFFFLLLYRRDSARRAALRYTEFRDAEHSPNKMSGGINFICSTSAAAKEESAESFRSGNCCKVYSQEWSNKNISKCFFSGLIKWSLCLNYYIECYIPRLWSVKDYRCLMFLRMACYYTRAKCFNKIFIVQSRSCEKGTELFIIDIRTYV